MQGWKAGGAGGGGLREGKQAFDLHMCTHCRQYVLYSVLLCKQPEHPRVQGSPTKQCGPVNTSVEPILHPDCTPIKAAAWYVRTSQCPCPSVHCTVQVEHQQYHQQAPTAAA